ncbi:MAG: cysteine--tRNA ligase [Opitutae bacterium]|nr:cysteine--tRNA ligase [Opitutae bacterium]MBT5692573.1 cysteine--tRNA ligase [Opitutae bacterium]MBT6463630.1 cysteine--tRNA ligase [Opitutae bacterium]MBT7854881.1 cysteine--tRNA ligase [Opitutae bacterium]
MKIQLHNTLTGKREDIDPENKGKSGFYCCGPTVYGPAHIGNFRTFLLQDVFRRVMEMEGINVHHVRNLTDVDDKTIRQSLAENMSLADFTEMWTVKFHADCEQLNMRAPHDEPTATGHIKEQVDLIERLIDANHAYVAQDGSVYFRITSFSEYGRLSNLDQRETQTQATSSSGDRNDADEYDRETVADFALWKAHKEEDGDNAWDSPWGRGRPGWHIECSAMSMKYLGESFDIHGGGIDLCFPHHENEIAQSEAATKKPFARHWFHCAHLMVDGGKMSKSLGNLYTLEDLVAKGYPAQVIRYLLISGSYRQSLNFTFQGLQAAQSGIQKLEKTVANLCQSAEINKNEFRGLSKKAPNGEMEFFQKSREDLCHDLNTSACLGNIFSTLKKLSIETPDKAPLRTALEELATILEALGIQLIFEKEDGDKDDIPPEVNELAEKRWQAKQDKDWEAADQLRDELQHKGWKILDHKDGYDLEKA